MVGAEGGKKLVVNVPIARMLPKLENLGGVLRERACGGGLADPAGSCPTLILVERVPWPSGGDEFGFQFLIAAGIEGRLTMVVGLSCEPR